MKMFQCVSDQDFLTRTLHVLVLLATLEKMTSGLPLGLPGAVNYGNQQAEGTYLMRKHNFNSLHHLVKRNSEMSNAQETYAQFYSKLVSFSNEIPTKMKSGAPRVLVANIGAVAEIIKPTDFIDLDANSVIKYVMLTLAITENFLQEVDTCQHVRSDNQSWFSNEKGALDFMITINRMSMASLRLSATDTVEDVDHGIGGVNSGVYNGISSSVLKQIKELLVALAEGC